MNHHEIAILILAAGSSSRLGYPKQLVEFQGKNLISHIIDESLQAELGKVYVVLGGNKELIQKEIRDKSVSILYNELWEKGMSESIAFGVSQILKTQKTDYIILLPSDQPYVTSSLLKKLHDEIVRTESLAVLCQYKNGAGPPTIFHHTVFDQLTKLQGDNGAKSIIQGLGNQVSYIDFPRGDIDIDTEKDVEKLM